MIWRDVADLTDGRTDGRMSGTDGLARSYILSHQLPLHGGFASISREVKGPDD